MFVSGSGGRLWKGFPLPHSGLYQLYNSVHRNHVGLGPLQALLFEPTSPCLRTKPEGVHCLATRGSHSQGYRSPLRLQRQGLFLCVSTPLQHIPHPIFPFLPTRSISHLLFSAFAILPSDQVKTFLTSPSLKMEWLGGGWALSSVVHLGMGFVNFAHYLHTNC